MAPSFVSGAISTAAAGQVMLSSGCIAVRPRVTGTEACVIAVLISAAQRTLRWRYAACDWSHGRNVAGCAGGRDEVNRWMPLPLSEACRMRQAAALCPFAIAARPAGGRVA